MKERQNPTNLPEPERKESKLRTFKSNHKDGIYGAGAALLSAGAIYEGRPVMAGIVGTLSVGLFALDGLSAMVRKSKTMRSLDNKDTKGFHTSPNESVDLLEEHLGISFPQKPEKIELNMKNTIVYLKKDPLDALSAKRHLKKDGLAFYEHTYKAYFTKENAGLFTDLHENMHAFTNNINPDFHNVFEAMTKNRLSNNQPRSSDTEKYVVYGSVNEGIAQWAAIATMGKIIDKSLANNEFSEEISNQLHKEAMGRPEIVLSALKTPPQPEWLISLRQSAEKIQQQSTLTEINLRSVRARLRLMREAQKLMDVKYLVGTCFTAIVMDALHKSGLSTQDALETLIKNPPTTIDELANPNQFASEKLLS